jgi:hypothetical protein
MGIPNERRSPGLQPVALGTRTVGVPESPSAATHTSSLMLDADSDRMGDAPGARLPTIAEKGGRIRAWGNGGNSCDKEHMTTARPDYWDTGRKEN